MAWEWELKLRDIHLHPIAMPLVHRFETSFGEQSLRAAVLVQVISQNQTEGWGEVVANWTAGYSYETTQTALHILQDELIPAARQQGTLSHEAATWAWLGKTRGHPLAKHGLISAILAAAAAEAGISLAEALRRMAGAESTRPAVEVGVSIGIEASIDDTLGLIEGYLGEGYGRIKLKIKPGWDIALLRAVRAAFPDINLMADANSAYTLEDTPLLRQMDALGLLMIEQPLDYEDIYEHHLLQKDLTTPLCLDESLHTLGHVQLAHHLAACRIVNLKPQRVGGVFEALKIWRFCQEAGLGLWVGGMLETGIGRAMSLALAALPGVNYPSDLSATKRYYAPDIARPYFELGPGSTLSVPTGPGLGVQIDSEVLQAAKRTYQQQKP
jgi:O-succinylbenzoate synthase